MGPWKVLTLPLKGRKRKEIRELIAQLSPLGNFPTVAVIEPQLKEHSTQEGGKIMTGFLEEIWGSMRTKNIMPKI